MFTVAPPINTQNDRLYVSATIMKRDVDVERLLRTRQMFSRSVMVSVAVSQLGCSDMFLVEPGVNVNGAYYRDVLSKQQMLSAIRRMSGDFFITSRTAHLRTVHGKPSSCYDVQPQTSLDRISGQRTQHTSFQSTTGFGG